jgi:serralysin
MCWLCWTSSGVGESAPSAPGGFTADAPAETAPRLFLTATGHAGVDGLFSGFAWADGDPVSFAFPDSASDYEAFYGSSEPARGFAQIGAGMRDAVRRILLGDSGGATAGPGSPGPSLLGFTLLGIVETGQDAWADVRLARSSAPSTAWAYYPNGREGGDVWFGSRYAFDNPRLGTYQFMVAVHELGHAFGLKHPHESWNGFGAMPVEWDSLEFTVMSYRSKVGATVGAGYTNGTYDYAQGWMMLDIAALQAMYGADYSHRAGDTRYAWDPATGETSIDGVGRGRPGDGAAGANRVFLTIWDGGGVDTYDLSAYGGGVNVDLAPGGHSVLSAAQLALLDTRDGTKARGNVFNSLLHDGNTASLIENAVGGAGADTLRGNVAANQLEGDRGNDLLDGRDGADWLDGGAGADTMIGSAGHDSFVQRDAADLVVEEADGGIDTVLVEAAIAVTLPMQVEILRLGAAGRHGIGNGLSNLLVGGATADMLDGRGGNDVLEGRGGNDTLVGGSGADAFVHRPGDGLDRIEDFTPGEDFLQMSGHGLSAAAILAQAAPAAGGVMLDLGSGAGVFLAGLTAGRLTVADIVV